MKKYLLIAVILSVLIVGAGCQGDSLKSANYQSRSDVGAEADADAEGEIDADAGVNPETDCSTLNPHPIAQGMVDTYDVSYDEVMTWYCDGYAFSDILLALETSDLADVPVPDLLPLARNQTWDEIWDELGISPEL
ncbi:MAG: hypothetical protein K8R16_01000 [Anaerolineales bacterium]|nr:hypothetical protein [Anaerolineales bacterium]